MIRHGKTDELSRSKHYKYTSSPHKHRSLDVHNHSHLVHPTGTSSFDRNNNSYSHNQSKRGGRGGSNSGVIDRTNLNVSFSPGKHKKYQHHSLTYFKHNLHNIDEDAKANNTYANDTEHKHADTDNMPANLKELSSIMRQTNNASLLSMY